MALCRIVMSTLKIAADDLVIIVTEGLVIIMTVQ